MSNLFQEDKAVPSSNISLPSLTIDDFYEFLYRLIGGLLLYISIFSDNLDFSRNNIFNLFLNDSLINSSLFGNIFLIIFLLTLSIVLTQFFVFINIFNYLLFYLGKQFKEDSFFYKLTFFIRKSFFPMAIISGDDKYDKNFSDGVQYLYNLALSKNVEVAKIPKPISSYDFFEIINEYMKNKKRQSYQNRIEGKLNFVKCIFISIFILFVRSLFVEDYLISFFLFFFDLIILNSIKKYVEDSRKETLINFYSHQLFKDDHFDKN